LAILAAIAIPALTGYIKKAQDKQYISEARNIAVAMKTVLTEAYASGEISNAPYPNSSDGIYHTEFGDFSSYLDYFTRGEKINDDTVSFSPADLADGFNGKAARLIGESYPTNMDEVESMKYWYYTAYAAEGSGATMATADGFMVVLIPEGLSPGKPMIAVTYRIKKIDPTETDTEYHYDPTAGYEVYQETYPEPEPEPEPPAGD
jgi:type II secretory pathway pseudopilin PulG